MKWKFKTLFYLFITLTYNDVILAEDANKESEFEEYILKQYPGDVEINATNLAKCSAQMYAAAFYIKNNAGDTTNYNIKIMSEYLFVLAATDDKAIANEVYDVEKNKYLSSISIDKRLDIPKSEQIYCIKVSYKAKKQLDKYLQNSGGVSDNSSIYGYWIDYYTKWDQYLSSRDRALDVEIVYFDKDGSATLAYGALDKTSNKIIFDFTSSYVLAKGQWSIIDQKLTAHFKVIKTNSFKYRKALVDSVLNTSYSLFGEKLITENGVLIKIDPSIINFVDKIKLFSQPTKNEQIEINKILYILDKQAEITKKSLLGNADFTAEDKEIGKIDIDKEYLGYTENEIKERDNMFNRY